MAPITFSVSEVRVAATCPRICYFDAEHARRHRLKTKSVTRLWKAGDGETACGSMFHNAVESFNRQALDAPQVRDALESEREARAIQRRLQLFLNAHCINLTLLAAKPAVQQQGLIRALDVYMSELAAIASDALHRCRPPAEIIDHLFGDRRRRVDATFDVGPRGEPVHVVGVLDYVFYDWRTANHRIIDYKLTPAADPSNDLFQVALYALMHHVQHRTKPDVGVLYLHPERTMMELSWDQVHHARHKLFDLLASMAGWVRYDEAQGLGLKPAGEPGQCRFCRWDKNGACVERLGPKHEGRRLHHWTDSVSASPTAAEPAVEVQPTASTSLAWAVNVEETLDRASQPAQGTETTQEEAETGLRIGSLVQEGGPIELPTAALPTHVAVVGAAGSGKTWMAKVVAEEAVRLGIPVLALDPQGDLVQFLRAAPEPVGLSAGERANRQAFLDRVETRVWTPGSSHGRRLSLDPIRLARRRELARIAEPDRRDEEWDGMLAVAVAQLVSLARVGGETDSQQTFLLQVLRALTRDENDGTADVDLRAVVDAIVAPSTVGLDDPDQFIKRAEREKLARKLNGLRVGPIANLFNGGWRLDVGGLLRPESPGKTPLNVVYLNALAGDDQKHFFVAALAAEVYRWMITSADDGAGATPGRPRLLVYLDEARDYLPAGAAKPPAKLPLIRLFTQGRKYGVACLLCTQSPRSVDYNVFGNCSTKLIGRLEAAQDLERVTEWFTTQGPAPSWIAGRKGAAAGSFVGRWPGMPSTLDGRLFRSRTLYSRHEGAWTPERLELETAAARRT